MGVDGLVDCVWTGRWINGECGDGVVEEVDLAQLGRSRVLVTILGRT